MSVKSSVGALFVFGMAMFLTACGSGGSLTLVPGARLQASNGSPFVSLNQGGRALIVQQGQTATTGVHGWLTIQAVSSNNLSGSNGTSLVLNRTQAFR